MEGLKGFARRDETERGPADLNRCLDNRIDMVWNEIKYKASMQRDYGELPHLSCYPQQLSQVFINLLVNAVHAIEEQGEIRVRTWHDRDKIYVSVVDTGCGIPVENFDRVFDPFFTTKEVGKGTGLGMSI